jgi:HK97 family phage portal protein
MLNRLFTPRESETRDLSYQQIWGSGLDVSTLATWSGTSVSSANSLQIGAVYACVRLLSDTISALPIDTFICRDGNRVPYRPRPAWVMEPDGPGSSRIDYFQQIVVSMLISHGAVVQILRDSRGEVAALVPLDPTRVDVKRNPQTRRPEYHVDGGRAVLPSEEVLYIPEMRRPGSLKGVSRIEEVKNTLGLAKALDEFASRYFSNGASVSGIIEFPGNLTQEQAKDVVTAFEAAHKGVGRSHRPGVLSGGAKFSKLGSDAEQAQMLQSRQFAVEEIARIFRVPPSMIGLNTPGAMSYASVEHNAIQFVRYSLLPLVAKIEEAHTRLLPSESFLRINVDGLMRGDSTAQAQMFSTGLQAGYFSVNDIRNLLDLPPMENGDAARVPLANINIADADVITQDRKVLMAQRLVQSGFDPAESLAAMGLPPIAHTGVPSVMLQGVAQIEPDDPQSVYGAHSAAD